MNYTEVRMENAMLLRMVIPQGKLSFLTSNI